MSRFTTSTTATSVTRVLAHGSIQADLLQNLSPKSFGGLELADFDVQGMLVTRGTSPITDLDFVFFFNLLSLGRVSKKMQTEYSFAEIMVILLDL